MFKRLALLTLIFLCFQTLSKSLILEDRVCFTFKGSVITLSDLKAYAYIFNLDYRKERGKLLKKVITIEKKYYCLKANYPFESDFEREFPSLFYKLNFFSGNRYLKPEGFEKNGLDFEIVKQNLFKLLFVLKYSFLLDKEDNCLKEPVYSTKND